MEKSVSYQFYGSDLFDNGTIMDTLDCPWILQIYVFTVYYSANESFKVNMNAISPVHTLHKPPHDASSVSPHYDSTAIEEKSSLATTTLPEKDSTQSEHLPDMDTPSMDNASPVAYTSNSKVLLEAAPNSYTKNQWSDSHKNTASTPRLLDMSVLAAKLKLSSYSGRYHEDPCTFTQNLSNFFSIAGIEDEQHKVEFALLHMEGVAKRWSETHLLTYGTAENPQQATWAQLAGQLSHRFRTPEFIYGHLCDLNDCLQRENECVDDYVAEMAKQATLAGVSDDVLYACIQRGLLPYIRYKLIHHYPQTLCELIQKAKLIEQRRKDKEHNRTYQVAETDADSDNNSTNISVLQETAAPLISDVAGYHENSLTVQGSLHSYYSNHTSYGYHRRKYPRRQQQFKSRHHPPALWRE